MMGFAPERVQGDDGQWHEVPLCADAGNEDEWSAIDFTMGVPKSVSVLWAVSDKYTRYAIENAVTAATMAFVGHLEAFATPMRRRDPANGEVIHEKAAGLIATAYRHDTSRPVGGETAPQLHDHILIAAVAPRVVKSRGKYADFGKLDTRELFKLRGEAAAVSATVLIRELRELGFEIEREGTAWEVKGVGKEVRDAFSPRSAQVTAALDEMTKGQLDGPTREQRELAVLRTREGKEGPSTDALFEGWREKATALELDPSALRSVGPKAETASLGERREMVLNAALRQLEASRASFEVGHFRLAVAIESELLLSTREVTDLLREVGAAKTAEDYGALAPDLVLKANGHLTTRHALDREKRILSRLDALQGHAQAAVLPSDADRLAKKVLSVSLSEDQANAVAHLLNHRVAVVEAPAGTGKGTVAAAYAAIVKHRYPSRQIITLATSGKRESEFGAEVKATIDRTIERFVSDVNAGRLELHDGDTVLIDEVGQLETARWDAVLAAIGTTRVRLAAFGDREQHGAIEVGGLLPVIAEKVPTVTLTTNWRNVEDAPLWTAVREGRSADALAEYDRRGLLDLSATQRDAIRNLIADWSAHRASNPGEATLIVTDRSNYTVDQLNAAAQAVIGNERPGLEVTYIDPEKEYTRVETLRVGDPVQAVANINRAVRSDGRKINIKNGQGGKVARIEDDGLVIEWVGRGEARVDAKRAQRLRLAYASHTYKGQGMTTGTSYTLLGGWQTSRASGYVGVSRSRVASRIYADYESLGLEADATREEAIAELGKAMARDRSQEAATAGLDPEPGESLEVDAQRDDRKVIPFPVERVWTPAQEEVTQEVAELSPDYERDLGHEAPWVGENYDYELDRDLPMAMER